MTAPADGWKMTDAEITDCYTPNVHMEDADLDRAIAEAAGRKALLWAAQKCESEMGGIPYDESHGGASHNDCAQSCAAAIREAAK